MKYEVEVQIEAEPQTVWEALADVERWPEWTRSMTSVERLGDGPFGLGSMARVQQPKLAKAVYTVTEFDSGRSFTWTTRAAGVRTVAGHYVEPRDEGGTNVRLVLKQTGAFTAFVGLFAGRLIRSYLTMEAEGLKYRGEGRI
jgi:uncharacterized protein YndB with AHSA1/START domain